MNSIIDHDSMIDDDHHDSMSMKLATWQCAYIGEDSAAPYTLVLDIDLMYHIIPIWLRIHIYIFYIYIVYLNLYPLYLYAHVYTSPEIEPSKTNGANAPI